MPEIFQDVVDYNQLHNKTELFLNTHCTDISYTYMPCSIILNKSKFVLY